jgi:hypothetical protein
LVTPARRYLVSKSTKERKIMATELIIAGVRFFNPSNGINYNAPEEGPVIPVGGPAVDAQTSLTRNPGLAKENLSQEPTSPQAANVVNSEREIAVTIEYSNPA